jgi:6-methylsalicylate decarboxylase
MHVTTYDLHQHLWPPSFVDAMRRREQLPCLRGQTLELGEGSFELELADHELERRLATLDDDGIEVAVVSLQTTLGIDELPAEERDALVEVYDAGILELAAASGGRIRAFAAGAFRHGFAGQCLSARVLARLHEVAATLDDLERAGAVLFVHPGPAILPPSAPPWWAAVVDYTSQMQAAYAVWLAEGALRWPNLRVLFAILAGGAPFQLERLASQGVETREVLHRNVHFDTASYGARALEVCLATFGVGALVYGSDRPVIDAAPTLKAVRGFGQAVEEALCVDNPTRLLV